MSISVESPERFSRVMSGFYGDEWLNWTADATEAVLRDNFDYDPTSLQIEKIEALKEVLRSNRVINNPLLFEKTTLLFNDQPATFEVWEGTKPKEIVYSFMQMRRFMGKDIGEKMSHSTKSYIASNFVGHDLYMTMDLFYLDFIEDYLNELTDVKEEIQKYVKQFVRKIIKKPEETIKRKVEKMSLPFEEDEEQLAKSQIAKLLEIGFYLKRKGIL